MTKQHNEREYVTSEQARALLGISRAVMARLLSDGTLAWEPNPVDRRSKIIKLADVQALLKRVPPKALKTPEQRAAAA